MTEKIKELMESLPEVTIRKEISSGRQLSFLGTITTQSRAIFTSHEFPGTLTKVDTEIIGGEKSAEWIGRKLIGILRRTDQSNIDQWSKEYGNSVRKSRCVVPDNLCGYCPTCKRYGALDPGKKMAWSRVRIGDLYSVQPAKKCIAADIEGHEKEQAVGNAVSQNRDRPDYDQSSATYYHYEYVRPGTVFPFVITVIDPDKFDLVCIPLALKAADNRGYGKYSSRLGKMKTEITHIIDGTAIVSPLDLTLAFRENEEFLEEASAEELALGDVYKLDNYEEFLHEMNELAEEQMRNFDLDKYFVKEKAEKKS